MAHVSQAARAERALQRIADRVRPPPIAPARCFTAVDPAGTVLVKFTRLSRRGVERAIAGHRAGDDDTACQNWPAARKAGWRVVPVKLTQVTG